MFDKLSVALIANVVVVSVVTNDGVPEITPLVVKLSPLGKDPLNKVYVIVVAGVTAEADNVIVIGNNAG